jgi:hypothetical protein
MFRAELFSTKQRQRQEKARGVTVREKVQRKRWQAKETSRETEVKRKRRQGTRCHEMSQERGVKQKKEVSTERQRERCAKRGRCDKKNVKRRRCHEKEMPKEEMPREMPSYTVLATARGSDTLKCMGKTLCLGPRPQHPVCFFCSIS